MYVTYTTLHYSCQSPVYLSSEPDHCHGSCVQYNLPDQQFIVQRDIEEFQVFLAVLALCQVTCFWRKQSTLLLAVN